MLTSGRVDTIDIYLRWHAMEQRSLFDDDIVESPILLPGGMEDRAQFDALRWVQQGNRRPRPPIGLSDEIGILLEANAVVAVGVSGGKDSIATGLAVHDHLNSIGHKGPRLLVHSDLGRVEWKDSLPACERLAERIGWELLTVRRQAGDMLARWESRWESNVKRYRDLESVSLILPWSTPSMRFCTSELKTAVICSALKKRYPDQHIINASGIRAQESSARAKQPVAKPQNRLAGKGMQGWDWAPIHAWKHEDVFSIIADNRLALHEAYTRYGVSRVSCAYCIMSSGADLLAAAGCADNHDLYRDMVALETRSSFAFQGARWLGDVAPALLSSEQRAAVAEAKQIAVRRQQAEAAIPEHLRFKDGWPESVPTADEANLLAGVRREVASLLRLDIGYTTGESVRERIAQLKEEGDLKRAAKAAAEAASARRLALAA